jgi:PKD repeat protein
VVSYEWYLDNVLIGDSSTLSHVFDVKGSYEVTLIVKDAEGLQAKDSVVIQVNEQEVIEQDPSVSLSSSSDYVKVGENATFSAAVENFAGNELQYTWLVDGEQVAQSSSATFQYRFTSAGSHKITVKVSDGNKTVESSVMIKVNEEPDIPVKFDFGEGNDASGTEIPFITSDADESKYDALSLAAEKNLIFTIRNITGQATIRVQRSSSSTAATSAVENTCKIISGYKVDCESSSGSDFILVENDSSVNLSFINGGDYKVHVDAKTLTGSDISGYIPVKVEAESTNNEVKDEGGKKGGGAMDPLSLVLMTCAGFFIRRRKQK